jgi:hypothetical protein
VSHGVSVGSATHPFVPVRQPLVSDGATNYGPPSTTEEGAEEWIRAYERQHGLEGISGWRVEHYEGL